MHKHTRGNLGEYTRQKSLAGPDETSKWLPNSVTSRSVWKALHISPTWRAPTAAAKCGSRIFSSSIFRITPTLVSAVPRLLCELLNSRPRYNPGTTELFPRFFTINSFIDGRTRTRTLNPLIKDQLVNFAFCAFPHQVKSTPRCSFAKIEIFDSICQTQT
jgi:hypothetical protein